MKKTLLITLIAVAAGVWMIPEMARAETFRLTIGAGHPVPASSWVAPMQSFLQVEVKNGSSKRPDIKLNGWKPTAVPLPSSARSWRLWRMDSWI